MVVIGTLVNGLLEFLLTYYPKKPEDWWSYWDFFWPLVVPLLFLLYPAALFGINCIVVPLLFAKGRFASRRIAVAVALGAIVAAIWGVVLVLLWQRFATLFLPLPLIAGASATWTALGASSDTDPGRG
jgi:hypothetical protein